LEVVYFELDHSIRAAKFARYARAYDVVLATMFVILVTDLIFGIWPQLHAALLLAMCIILGTGFFVFWDFG